MDPEVLGQTVDDDASAIVGAHGGAPYDRVTEGPIVGFCRRGPSTFVTAVPDSAHPPFDDKFRPLPTEIGHRKPDETGW